jgi:hypothetical protein
MFEQESLFETRAVRQERTGWRDARISERHRQWGILLPAIDLDFVLIEYDRGRASALVEYKHERAQPQYPSHPSYRALSDLGSKEGIPVFGVRYADDFSWFRVSPLNRRAKAFVRCQAVMTEREWVSLLYRTKGRRMPEDLLDNRDFEL